MNRTCLLLLLAIGNLLIACGSSDRIEKNIQNSQKLRVGMTLEEALRIMGEPHEVRTYSQIHPIYHSPTTVYFYESPIGASDWISFEIDTTNRIVEVTPYELKSD
jgi:hypothetical protein